ncbi:MAG: glycoside hydrolase family 88 protein [Haliscomenobacter sp.]|nr:glycoside hydrolase family 88 protein [Haliscomenobacter sp.]
MKISLLLLILFVNSSLFGSTDKSENIYSQKFVTGIMQDVFNWQLQNPVLINELNQYWARSAFYSGVMYAYNTTGQKNYLNQTIIWADKLNWRKPGKKYRFADDLACGQAFLDVYKVKKEAKMLEGIQHSIDTIISVPKAGREDWWWCDALFMEPSVWVRLANVTNDSKYFTVMDEKYWDSADYLFSNSDSLYFRDKNYFNAVSKNGKKVFWGRGNAWVMAGLTQMLNLMPLDNQLRPKYIEHYKKMMYKIASLQQEDGLWRASLLDPDEVPIKETSGSVFYTFAMAWGVNNNVLPADIFLPKITKAWKALVGCVNYQGMLGYVQPIGASPDKVRAEDFQEYGSGGFLMAGSEMLKLTKKMDVLKSVKKNNIKL